MLHYFTCSPMDAPEWMGAARMRVQMADIKHCNNPQVTHNNYLQEKTVQNTLVDFDLRGQLGIDILIMNLFLTIMQLFTSQDVNWWTGFSFWWHPFTAEGYNGWATDAMTNLSKSVMMKKQIKSISSLVGQKVSKRSANVHFWVNYSFKRKSQPVYVLTGPCKSTINDVLPHFPPPINSVLSDWLLICNNNFRIFKKNGIWCHGIFSQACGYMFLSNPM